MKALLVIDTQKLHDLVIAKRTVHKNKEKHIKGKIVFKGGKGSGNHGHAGRPGKVGGSGGDSGGYVSYTFTPTTNISAVKLDKTSVAAVEKYQSNSYDINGYLREGPIGYAPEDVQRDVIRLNRVFSAHGVTLREDTVLYRGIDAADMSEGIDKAFMSTTTDPMSAAFFGDAVMRLSVPAGTKVLPLLQGKENEVLLQQGLTLSVGTIVGYISRRGEEVPVYDVAVS